VVEFWWNNAPWKGVVYQDHDMVRIYTECLSYVPQLSQCDEIKYIDHIAITNEATGCCGLDDDVRAYFSKPLSYAERQAKWVKEVGLKVGDKVKVVRKNVGNENGYACTGWWNHGKKEQVGKVSVVVEINRSYICLKCKEAGVDSGNFFPYFILEKV
jgi:hypothetical protein